MTRRTPIHIRIDRLRLPHLAPGGELLLRDEIHRELNLLIAEEHSGQPIQSQARIVIPCPSQREAANPRFIARQIAAAIRQSGQRR